MKKYLITILCVCLAIPVFAGEPRLNRSDLQQVTMFEDQVSEAPEITGAESVQPMQQFMREVHLTLNEDRPRSKSPQKQSIEDLLGARIASVDAYNFYWDSDNQIAIVDSTSYAMKGSYCQITYSVTTGKMYLVYFFNSFTIPMEIDLLTDSVTIKAGQVLSSIKLVESTEQPLLSNNALNSQGIKVYWRLYAMPLSWLTGNDNYDDIHGHVGENGTITFNDDFAFLVKSETTDGELRGWRLSPIFKNLILLKPNGKHTFIYTRPSADNNPISPIGPGGEGYGGLVPTHNKPGTKPVNPRPISSENRGKNPFFYSNRFSELFTPLLHFMVWPRYYEPLGFAGLVPRKPGSSKPTSTGPFNDVVCSSAPSNDFNTILKSGSSGSINLDSVVGTLEQVPVYMILTDSTTLMVYNLFGLGNRCHMEISQLDGTMYLPVQEIYNNGLGSVIYNNANTGIWSQDSISWGTSSIYDDDGNYDNCKLTNNILTFVDGVSYSITPQPTFVEPIMTETSVVFRVTAPSPNFVSLYMYDDESDDYFEVNNPVILPRQNEPYRVYLAAQAYNPNTFIYSEISWFDYEIPALETIGIHGDVNLDGHVSISDVTAMINGLLSSNWEDISFENADCNLDGDVTISDVTTLINYLLSGNWSD